MIKFDVYEENFEFRADLRRTGATAEQIWNWYQDADNRDPQRKGSFDSLEEARAELQHIHPYSSHQRGFALQLVVGRLGWIEENEYDEDGEFDQSIAIWDVEVADLEKESSWVCDEE